MKRLALLFVLVACGTARSEAPAVTSLAMPAPRAAASVASVATPPPRAPSVTVVVTGAPYGGLALWRASSTGKIEPLAFPWATLTVIDSLVVSPDGRDVAYAEGGSPFGPLLVRALDGGAKTVVAPHAPGGELLAVAWSPDGRRLLYRSRRAAKLSPRCHFSGCPGPGPSTYFVFDRDDGKSTKVDVAGELAAWLPSGEMLFVDDDGGLVRIDHGTKLSIAGAPRMRRDFALDTARHRVVEVAWNDATHRDELLALDLATWSESALAPPAPYATYLWPHASPSGKRVAWLATAHVPHGIPLALVVDGKTLVAPTRDLTGFAWLDDDTLVAHYADRLDVLDANDGRVKGSRATGAHDTLP